MEGGCLGLFPLWSSLFSKNTHAMTVWVSNGFKGTDKLALPSAGPSLSLPPLLSGKLRGKENRQC